MNKLSNLSDEDLKKYKEKYEFMLKNSKRAEIVKFHNGLDRKFCYHVVRLLGECEQILTEHDLDLQRNREHLKAIRRGEVSFEDIKKYFSEKEASLEKLYHESTLRHSPDEDKIKKLLIDCLEHHYGSLEEAVVNIDQATIALRQINEIIMKNQMLL